MLHTSRPGLLAMDILKFNLTVLQIVTFIVHLCFCFSYFLNQAMLISNEDTISKYGPSESNFQDRMFNRAKWQHSSVTGINFSWILSQLKIVTACCLVKLEYQNVLPPCVCCSYCQNLDSFISASCSELACSFILLTITMQLLTRQSHNALSVCFI